MKKNNGKYCLIYLVRHGETDWNVQGVAQGQTDIPLNETGVRQAQEAAKRFSSIRFDAFFSSDLSRAKATAQIIALEHKLLVTAHEALRERQFGELEGKKINDFRELIKKFEHLTEEEFKKVQFVPGAETTEQVISRVITYIREIAIAYPGKTVLMASHGGVLRSVLLHLGYWTVEEFKFSKLANTAHVKLRTDGVDFFVEEVFGVEKEPKL